jgi:hypothetical protein
VYIFPIDTLSTENLGDVYGTLLNSEFEFFYPCGDVNADGKINGEDISYLANYLFFNAPPSSSNLDICPERL